MKGKKYTFYNLIKEQTISIPEFQRDYAQGRVGKKYEEIRENFVSDLFEFIKDENKRVNLDFIYGVENNNQFIPVDGQQRLTTLFLLHLYLAVRSSGEFKNYKELFKKFTYAVRPESKKFLELLLENIEKLRFDIEIKKEIINSTWFLSEWNSDITINSLLNVLDTIYKKCRNENYDELWKKLISTDNPPIVFYFLNMKDDDVNDLYIKMNSRGRQLTEFENFKSKFEDFIKEKKKLSKEKFNTWIKKIDNDWMDLFWKYKVNNNFTEEYDRNFMNFFKGITLFNYVIQNRDKDNEIFESLHNYDYLQFIEYKKIFENKEVFFDVKDIFDILNIFSEKTDNNFKIEKMLDEISFSNESNMGIEIEKKVNLFLKEKNLFEKFITKPSYRDRILFFSFIKFIKENKDKEFEIYKENLFRFLRVIRNLVYNTDIEKEKFFNIIKSINSCSLNNNDIYDIFKNELTCKFNKEQEKEEQIKIKLINQNEEWEKELLKIENHPLFEGYCGFLLDLENIDKNYIYNFDSNRDVVLNLFDKDGSKIGKDEYLLIRAIIAKSNTTNYTNIGNWNLFLKDEKDNWKNNLLKNEIILSGLKIIIEKLKKKKRENYRKELHNICKNYIEESNYIWKYFIIKVPDLLSSEADEYKTIRNSGNGPFLIQKVKYTYYAIFLYNHINYVIKELLDTNLFKHFGEKEEEWKWRIRDYKSIDDGEMSFYLGWDDLFFLREIIRDKISLVFQFKVFGGRKVLIGIKDETNKRLCEKFEKLFPIKSDNRYLWNRYKEFDSYDNLTSLKEAEKFADKLKKEVIKLEKQIIDIIK